MIEPLQEEIISKVSSIFRVTNVVINPESLQFKVEDIDFKSKFVSLARQLESIDMLSRIEQDSNGIFVFVTSFERKKRKWLSKSWMPRILFAVTVTMVLIDGYFRTDFVNTLSFIGEPTQMSILYAFSLIGILGIHESGHLIAAKKHKIKTSWPYFIPGVPVFGIPTFGALKPSIFALPNTNIVTTGKNRDQKIELFLLKNILLLAIIKPKYIFISLLLNFCQSSL